MKGDAQHHWSWRAAINGYPASFGQTAQINIIAHTHQEDSALQLLLPSQLVKAALDGVLQCHPRFHLIHGRKVFTMAIVLLEDAYRFQDHLQATHFNLRMDNLMGPLL